MCFLGQRDNALRLPRLRRCGKWRLDVPDHDDSLGHSITKGARQVSRHPRSVCRSWQHDWPLHRGGLCRAFYMARTLLARVPPGGCVWPGVLLYPPQQCAKDEFQRERQED